MVFLLTEKEKLIIIIIASCLFLLSVLITVCIVSPICLFHKWLFKSHKYKKTPKQQIVTQESKHFQMSVIPHYGSYNGNDLISKESSKHNKKIEKQSFGNDLIATDELTENKSQIKILLYMEKSESESERLFITVEEVIGLNVREHKLEPFCYVTLEVLFGSKMRRKSFKNKAAFSFQTTTCKRGLGPVFNESFVTPELPKNIIKDGCLRIKVCDEERYANDICLGEVILPIKQIRKFENKNAVIYDLNQPKEIKGELFIEMCYLPTSNRITFSIIKATITNINLMDNHKAHYIRILMFANGKLIKKKKSSTSSSLNWGNQETMTFDLPKEETAFMIVLAYRNDTTNLTSSPSSPETPENDLAFSKKDKNVGHFILGKDQWIELKQQPRKQIIKWIKLT